ncbi:Hypothetical predicted protein [Mytilus galloprovincialis]|uniref:Uncharacterized protein n=1 Tax=Mytilus galloprovincialis TaxID=29158 RepID=A0A8B6GNI5_MYTGA|nr:Hypothetical predicted protein [Mytilus galloprovincialis]
MGRTARKTRSPYAAANRKSAHHSSDGETVIYRRTGSVNATTQRVPQQQPTASLSPELEQVADTVTQRIVPELKDQIAKAIEAIQRTPTLCSTPDTDLSGILERYEKKVCLDNRLVHCKTCIYPCPHHL